MARRLRTFADRRIGEDELVEIFEDGELGPADAVAIPFLGTEQVEHTLACGVWPI